MRPSLTSQVRGQYEIIDRALTVRSARSGLIANGLIACSQSRESASDEVADTIFLSGPSLTMDGASPPYVEAEAVIDGVIVYAGDNDAAKADATWWASPGFNISFNFQYIWNERDDSNGRAEGFVIRFLVFTS